VRAAEHYLGGVTLCANVVDGSGQTVVTNSYTDGLRSWPTGLQAVHHHPDDDEAAIR
jgi:hypothetical protein